ncbi:MAG: T9SS type A sorting domain-containing protein [Bacteroidales bacterium]|nr:T9SS type A sorting domain-containing protein [Bacteroidales bacterium]
MKKFLLLIFSMLAMTAGILAQEPASTLLRESGRGSIIYVNDDAGVPNNGTSWANAYTSFQSALDVAAEGDQVWVAAGTYNPSYFYGLTNEPRFYHFCMIEGVAIYGGFAGTETDVSQRTDFGMGGANETILSGDLNGNDVVTGSGATLSITNNSENCYHVFYHPDGYVLTNTALLDGFTIKGGNANVSGPHDRAGGMYSYNSAPIITNVTFLNNAAKYGGGMWIYQNAPTLTNVTFLSNYATNNCGGLFNQSTSNQSITGAIFQSNYSLERGGGMVNNNSSPTITNIVFRMNYAGIDGGGMYNYSSSSPTITNAVFLSNSSNYGGALYSYDYSHPVVTNATFSKNNAGIRGGGIYIWSNGSATFNNCIIWGNTTTPGINGQQICVDGGTTTLNYCCYANGTNDVKLLNNGTLTATNNIITKNPNFIDPASDFRILGNSPCVDAGSNGYNSETYDIRGEARIQNDTIDMGAYEWTAGLDPAVQIFYVNDDAPGSNDGTSWTDAFTSFQSALDVATSGHQIWVAAGTYKPSYDYGLNIAPPDTARGYHFRMIEGVEIYGGFAGNETAVSQRTDFGVGGANETILSGDIGTVGVNTDNCYHVFYHPYGLNLTSAVILDGFTITGGNANGSYPHFKGGGMYNNYSSPTITNATFSLNSGKDGGGMFNSDSSPTITNVTFQSNNSSGSETGKGGGLSNQYSSPTLTNVIFQSNFSGWGGGMYIDGSAPTLINTTFLSNSATYGGGMYSKAFSSVTLNNCIVWGNTADVSGKQFYLENAINTLNYSCYSNGTGDVFTINSAFTATNNNITKNPKFIDPADDFRIHGNSPCVNTGNNDYNSETYDIRGEARIQGDTIDMGAYEWTAGIDAATDTVYISAGATGSNTGTDWANAFTSFQSALDIAASGDQIWVATGTYYPSYDYGLDIGERGKHFRMIEGVEIYGGFAGMEDSISQRTDFGMGGANETFLSGDIGTVGVVTDNCYHIFYHPEGLNLTGVAILDGFTITEGNANGSNPHNNGGGMHNYNSSPTITNATFSSNSALRGGGMFNDASSPTITNATFSLNSAYFHGGGMYNNFSSPTITNATFSLNSADYSGGGMSNNWYSSPTITNATFSLNSADYDNGGGMHNFYSSPSITNTTFSLNSASIGGGMSNHSSSSPTIINATFSLNYADSLGGGIYNYYASPTFNNCIIWGNITTQGVDGQQFCLEGGTTTMNYSCFANGAEDVNVMSGTFVDSNSNITTNPKFVDPADDFRIHGNSPCVNTGFNDYFTLVDSVDIRGEARIQDNTIDMGAYEYTSGLDPAVQIFYVNDTATGSNTGANWANAFTSFQSALDLAAPDDQIWVAAGTYEPDYDYGLGIGERGYHFRMIEGVAIYGGFAGTEDSISQRTDFGINGDNETILSGDIGIAGDSTDNCYHVFYHPQGLNLTGAAMLDGFTITGGNADGVDSHGRGGGMMNDGPCSPTITNVSFRSNAAASGGGMFNSDSDPYLTNVIFLLNTAVESGGGIYNDVSSPSITNVTFSMNAAGNQGGGIYNLNSSPSLFNSIVWGNTASAGSQLYMDGGSTTLNYCCYANGAGDTTAVNSAVFTVTNNNITDDPKFVNPASDLRPFATSPCVNAGNNDYNFASTDIRGETRIQGTTIDMGAYEWITGTDPYGIYYVKHDAAGSNNGSGWDDAFTSIQSALDISVGGDQVWVAAGTYTPSYDYDLGIGERGKHFRMIEGAAIYGGFAGTEDSVSQRTDFGPGGAYETILSGDLGIVGDHTDNCYHVFYHPEGLNLTGAARLDGFTINGGHADGSPPHDVGGGMSNWSSSPAITYATFALNSASQYGGGIFNSSSSPTITNATFSSNSASNKGGGIYCQASSFPTLNNSIVWNNAAESGKQFYLDSATITLNYSCYANGSNDVTLSNGGTLTAANNNTTDNPKLDADLNLTWTNFPVDDATKSPCINTGDPLDWINNPNHRDPDQSMMDMGAKHYHQEPALYFYDEISCDNPPEQYNTDCYNHNFGEKYVNTSSTHRWFNIVNRVDKFTNIEFVFTGSHPSDFKLNSANDTILGTLQGYFPVLPYFQPTGTGPRASTLQVVSDGVIVKEVFLSGYGKGSGNIEGYVYAPGGEIPVSGVNITVFREEFYQGNLEDTISFYANTNLNGRYYIANVGFGSDFRFTVTPYHMTDGIEHDFDPEYYDDIIIENENVTYPVPDFINTSVFPFAGFVFYQGTQCPVEDVIISVNGINTTPTNEEGAYQLTLPIGNHTISLSKPGHTFNPPDTTIYVTSPLANINFEDEYTHHLHGFIGGACEIPLTLDSAQKIELNVHHVLECMADMTIELPLIGDSAGFYVIELPPGNYQLSIDENFYTEDFPTVPLNYSAVEVDLSENDTLKHDIIFLTEPVINVSWPDNESDTIVYYLDDIPVLHQINKYTAIVDVYRPYVNGTCPVPPGDTLQVYDGISDAKGWKDLIISDTTKYVFYAGMPNIIAGGSNPHQKKLQFQYVYDQEAREIVEYDIWVYVLGIKPRAGQAFTTTTPQIPLWIIRDPPGDNSYSIWEQSKTFSQSFSFSMARGLEYSEMSTAKLGVDFKTEIGFIVSTEVDVDVTNDIGVGYTTSLSQNSLVENQYTFSTTTSYATSQTQSGEGADLFVGSAINIIYGITDVLAIVNDTINISQDIILVPNGFHTSYVYSQSQILNEVIPSLALIGDQESVDMWEDIISLNNSLKDSATFIRSRSFGGGGYTIGESQTFDILSMTEISFEVALDLKVTQALGLTVNGAGGLFERYVTTSVKYGGSQVNTGAISTTTGFFLQDENGGDLFTFDIKEDPVYGTPVFDLISGKSSCPFEPGTQRRQGCEFDQPVYLKQEIVGDTANYEVELSGTGSTVDQFGYILSVMSETNPYGAVVTMDGENLSNGVEISLTNGQGTPKIIKLVRDNDFDVYELTGIALKLASTCGDPSIADTAILNAHFVPACTYVSIVEPNQNWVVNGDNTTLEIIIGGYDTTNSSFLNVELQYRYYGLLGWEGWVTKETYQKEELGDGYTTYSWDMEYYTDGKYQIRAVANCTNNQQTISPSKTGFVDKSPPILTSSGPANMLQPGVEIFFKYDQRLNPGTVNLSNCTLHNIDNLQTDLPISILLTEDSTRITFTIPPGMIYFAENQTLVAKVSELEDLYGNSLPVPDSIIFYVNLGPLHWSVNNFAFEIDPADSVSFISTLSNVSSKEVYYSLQLPEWLTATPSQGSLEPNGSVVINFQSENLSTGFYNETLFAFTLGFPGEEIHVDVQAGDPELSASPLSHQVLALAGEVIFNITSNVSWTVAEDVSWLSEEPMGSSNNGILTVSYNTNASWSGRTGIITLSAVGFTDIELTINQAGAVLSDSNFVVDHTVQAGEIECYEALQTITAQNLTFESGSTVRMVAGNKITLLPDVHAQYGADFHAWISDTDFCSLPPPAMASAEIETEQFEDEMVFTDKQELIRVYPNPGKGLFTLELLGSNQQQNSTVQIYTIMGERILDMRLEGGNNHHFDLSAKPDGIYVVVVINGNDKAIVKLIKM